MATKLMGIAALNPSYAEAETMCGMGGGAVRRYP